MAAADSSASSVTQGSTLGSCMIKSCDLVVSKKERMLRGYRPYCGGGCSNSVWILICSRCCTTPESEEGGCFTHGRSEESKNTSYLPVLCLHLLCLPLLA